MAKLVLNDVSSTLTNTAATTINNNNSKIEQALENTLSRDGSIPNNMQADIDMDGNDLLNVGNIDAESFTLDGSPIPALADVLLKANNLSDVPNDALARSNIGLGSVDNTADINKPVSTPQQIALDGKANTVHTHVMSDVTDLASALALKENKSEKGAINGYASLGADGLVPSSQLPVSGSYKGVWNANTNSPTITSGVGTVGDFYIVSVAGSTNIDGTSSWAVGDTIRFNGTAWQKIPNNAAVSSVNGQTGAVVLTATNIGSSAVGSVAATNVQSAIQELDSEKVAKSGDTMTGNLTIQKSFPSVLLRRTADTETTGLFVQSVDGLNDWILQHLGSGDATPNGIALSRRDAAGNFVDRPWQVNYTTGEVTIGPTTQTIIQSGIRYGKNINLAAATDIRAQEAGFYEGSSITNAPMTGGMYFHVKQKASVNDREIEATVSANGSKWVVSRVAGVWGSWKPAGGWVTPQHYGAVGDGVADDTTPLQLALRSGFPVLFTGTYRTTSVVSCGATLTAGSGSVIIQGSANTGVFVDHSGNGINFQLTASPSSFQNSVACLIAKDFWMRTSGSSSSSCGISIVGTGGSGSVVRTADLQNIITEGVSVTTGFGYGISLNNSRNSRIVGCSHLGITNVAAGSRAGAGILVTGDANPVDTTIITCWAYFARCGVEFLGTCEGMSVHDFTAVGCDRGVSAELDENPISGDNEGKPLLHVTLGHFNCFTYGVYMDRVRDYNITQNDFLVEVANSNWNGIFTDVDGASSVYGWIDGNKFQDAHGLSSGSTIGINVDAHTSGVTETRIGVQRYVSLKFGLNLSSNVKNCRYSGASVYAAVTTPVQNLGGGTNTAY